MPSLTELAENRLLRIILVGHPKAGKTGAVACLANAGWEIGILDFDNNPDPLVEYVNPEARDRVSIITLQDKVRFGAPRGGKEMVDVDEDATALTRAFRALDNWEKGDPSHPWGAVRTWGPNRILMCDSLTGMGDASFDRIKVINNRGGGRVTDADYNLAMNDQDYLLKKVMGEYHCHVIVTAHLKMIGPKIERFAKDDAPELVEAKLAISAANAEKVETRWYPSALGRALPQNILRRIPAAALVEARDGRQRIVIKPQANLDLDLGVPVSLPKSILDQATGLLQIMQAYTGKDHP